MPRGRTYKPGKRVPGNNNHGVIYTHAGTFEAFISYRGRRYTAGTHATLDEAREARDLRLRELQGGGSASSLRARRISFAEFFDESFFPVTYTRPSDPKRPSTLRAASSRYTTYLKPFFGHRAIADITRFVIQTFIAKLAAGEFSAPVTVTRIVNKKVRTFRPRRTTKPSGKTQREVLLLLRSALAAAVPELIAVNPFPPKSIPSGKNRDATATAKRHAPLSSKTILALIAKIPSLKHRTIALVLAYSGLRLGEALALEWGDIDFRRGFLKVERAADAKTRVVGPPKTAHSIREVPLDPVLASGLRRYRETLRTTPTKDTLVFPSARTGGVIDQRVFTQRYFDVARKKVTPERITPHTCRHLWCSTMVQRFPVADVSKWAGHHSPAFTYEKYVRPLERMTKGSPIKASIYGEGAR